MKKNSGKNSNKSLKKDSNGKTGSRRLRVLSVVSTRPELIKMAPVLKELDRRGIESVFVTTGQHYDRELFADLVSQLGLREPDADLAVGSGSHAFQTGEALKRLENVVLKHEPSVVLAEGDTNSILAAALASQKLLVPFGHVEAGLRSFDRRMPEEINRIMADHCSEILFAPTEQAALQLLLEKIPKHKVFVTGNTVVDACLQNLPLARKHSRIRGELPSEYYLLTLHRKENTGSRGRMKAVFEAAARLDAPVVFPMHPRTKKTIAEYGLKLENVLVLPPLGYFDFLAAEDGAKAILTDSGGVQEEATVLSKRCVVLRDNTERPEALGANCVLAGADARRIVSEARKPAAPEKCPFGDGKAANKIVSVIERNSLQIEASSFVGESYPEYVLEPVGAAAGKTVARFEKRNNGEINLVFEASANGASACGNGGIGCARYPHANRILRKNDFLLVKR